MKHKSFILRRHSLASNVQCTRSRKPRLQHSMVENVYTLHAIRCAVYYIVSMEHISYLVRHNDAIVCSKCAGSVGIRCRCCRLLIFRLLFAFSPTPSTLLFLTWCLHILMCIDAVPCIYRPTEGNWRHQRTRALKEWDAFIRCYSFSLVGPLASSFTWSRQCNFRQQSQGNSISWVVNWLQFTSFTITWLTCNWPFFRIHLSDRLDRKVQN